VDDDKEDEGPCRRALFTSCMMDLNTASSVRLPPEHATNTKSTGNAGRPNAVAPPSAAEKVSDTADRPPNELVCGIAPGV